VILNISVDPRSRNRLKGNPWDMISLSHGHQTDKLVEKVVSLSKDVFSRLVEEVANEVLIGR